MTGSTAWWTRVLAGPGGTLDTRAVDGERWLLLPTPQNPRVCVEDDCAVGVGDALSRFVDSRGLPGPLSTVARRAAPLAARVGSHWMVGAASGGRTLRQTLSAILDLDVRCSVSVGPPRPNMKPVVRCYDGAQLVAVAKLGPDPHTADMVRNEGRWLRTLGAEPVPGVVVPEVLHQDVFGEAALLVMSALPIDDDTGVTFDAVPADVLERFWESRPTSVGLAESPWLARLRERLATDPNHERRALVDSLGVDPGADEIPLAAWHGDWSPWNLAPKSADQWFVWDWERTADLAPRGFDLLHLHHQYGRGLDAAVSDLADAGLAPRLQPLVRRAYLLELTARHLEAGELDGDRQRTVDQLLRLAVDENE